MNTKIKEQILALKPQVMALHSYDKNEIDRITDTLLIYIRKVLPTEVESFKSSLKKIHYMPAAVYMGLAGFAPGNDRGEFAKGQKRLCDIIDNVITSIELNEDDSDENHKQSISNTKVFIVHGHDEAMREKVARTIEKLGLTPIILHEQSNKGQTIIEKLEENSEVGYAVVLLSPCDEGRKKGDKDFQPRARQNVIAEMGYFIGKLGRNKVTILRSNDVETPSDFLGVVYVPFDDNDGWQIKLAKELKSAGYSIKIENLL